MKDRAAQQRRQEARRHQLNGQLVDWSGQHSGANVQLTIMASSSADSTPGSPAFKPVLTTTTNQQGQFQGKIPGQAIKQAYALLSCLADEYIHLSISDEGTLPAELTLVTELSASRSTPA